MQSSVMPISSNTHDLRNSSLLRKIPLIIIEHVLQVAWLLSIDSASNSKACAQDLLCCALKRPGLAFAAHLPNNVDELILGDVAAVLDVLGLLSITKWFL